MGSHMYFSFYQVFELLLMSIMFTVYLLHSLAYHLFWFIPTNVSILNDLNSVVLLPSRFQALSVQHVNFLSFSL